MKPKREKRVGPKMESKDLIGNNFDQKRQGLESIHPETDKMEEIMKGIPDPLGLVKAIEQSPMFRPKGGVPVDEGDTTPNQNR